MKTTLVLRAETAATIIDVSCRSYISAYVTDEVTLSSLMQAAFENDKFQEEIIRAVSSITGYPEELIYTVINSSISQDMFNDEFMWYRCNNRVVQKFFY